MPAFESTLLHHLIVADALFATVLLAGYWLSAWLTSPTVGPPRDFRWGVWSGQPKFYMQIFETLGGFNMAVVVAASFHNPVLFWITFCTAFVVGFGIFALLWFSLVYWRIKYCLPLPPCRSGKCFVFGRDYVYQLGTCSGWIGPHLYNLQCHCGEYYYRIGNRFMLLDTDYALIPYKKLASHGDWVDDDGETHLFQPYIPAMF